MYGWKQTSKNGAMKIVLYLHSFSGLTFLPDNSKNKTWSTLKWDNWIFYLKLLLEPFGWFNLFQTRRSYRGRNALIAIYWSLSNDQISFEHFDETIKPLSIEKKNMYKKIIE